MEDMIDLRKKYRKMMWVVVVSSVVAGLSLVGMLYYALSGTIGLSFEMIS